MSSTEPRAGKAFNKYLLNERMNGHPHFIEEETEVQIKRFSSKSYGLLMSSQD